MGSLKKNKKQIISKFCQHFLKKKDEKWGPNKTKYLIQSSKFKEHKLKEEISSRKD